MCYLRALALVSVVAASRHGKTQARDCHEICTVRVILPVSNGFDIDGKNPDSSRKRIEAQYTRRHRTLPERR